MDKPWNQILLLILNFVLTLAADVQCPYGWSGTGSRCYGVFLYTGHQLEDRTWKTARMRCITYGGDLVSVNTCEEDDAITQLTLEAGDRDRFYWLGLTDEKKDGRFQWTDGSKLEYTKWLKGEPTSNNPTEITADLENYVVASGAKNWSDVANNWTTYVGVHQEPSGFICERGSLPATNSVPGPAEWRPPYIPRTRPISDFRTKDRHSLPVVAVFRYANQGLRPIGPSAAAALAVPVTHITSADQHPTIHRPPPPRYSPPSAGQQVFRLVTTAKPTPTLSISTRATPIPITLTTTAVPNSQTNIQYAEAQSVTPRESVITTRTSEGDADNGSSIGDEEGIGEIKTNDREEQSLGNTLVGEKGPTGEKGPLGDKGPIGDKGPPGDKGLPGAKGPTGDRGPIGEKGVAGDRGATGDRGPTGDKGPTGNKGPTGGKGPTGDKGPAGDRGFRGYAGPAGPRGPDGRPGHNGRPGRPGAPGPPGPSPIIAAIPMVSGDGVNESYVHTSHHTTNRGPGYVNATAFCQERVVGVYSHPYHCWLFLTCGAVFGGAHEMACHAGRRFIPWPPACIKDATCRFGDTSQNKTYPAYAYYMPHTAAEDHRLSDASIQRTLSLYGWVMVGLVIAVTTLGVVVFKIFHKATQQPQYRPKRGTTLCKTVATRDTWRFQTALPEPHTRDSSMNDRRNWQLSIMDSRESLEV